MLLLVAEVYVMRFAQFFFRIAEINLRKFYVKVAKSAVLALE